MGWESILLVSVVQKGRPLRGPTSGDARRSIDDLGD